MRQAKGTFIHEPEWHYMVHRSEDESRGFDAHGDLFSPGYFKIQVRGGGMTRLCATVTTSGEEHAAGRQSMKSSIPMCRSDQGGMDSVIPVQKVLEAALRQCRQSATHCARA